ARSRNPRRHRSSLVSRFFVLCRFTYSRRYVAYHVSAAYRTLTKRNCPSGFTGITVTTPPERWSSKYVKTTYHDSHTDRHKHSGGGMQRGGCHRHGLATVCKTERDCQRTVEYRLERAGACAGCTQQSESIVCRTRVRRTGCSAVRRPQRRRPGKL